MAIVFLGVDEVCSILGYKKSYVYKLTHEHRLPYYKVRGGKGRIRFDKAEIEELIQKGKIPIQNQMSSREDAILREGTRWPLI